MAYEDGLLGGRGALQRARTWHAGLHPDMAETSMPSWGQGAVLTTPMTMGGLRGLAAPNPLQRPKSQASDESAQDQSKQFMQSSSAEEGLGGAESTLQQQLAGDDDDDDSASGRAKRSKLEWTGDLHAVFVHAVEGLAVDAQVPSRILERMGGWGEGLTRANIASHLQKYRNRKRTKPGSHGLYQPSCHGAAPLPQPFSGGAGTTALGVPYYPAGAPLTAMRQAAAAPPPPHHHRPALPRSAAGPWAGGGSSYLGGLATGWVPQGPAAGAAGAGAQQWPLPSVTPPSSADLDRILGEFARSAGTAKPPIGLKLDCAAVLQQMNGLGRSTSC